MLTVFLGGSCKPTTWRDDHAVPFFDQSGISYFNPVRMSYIQVVTVLFSVLVSRSDGIAHCNIANIECWYCRVKLSD